MAGLIFDEGEVPTCAFPDSTKCGEIVTLCGNHHISAARLRVERHMIMLVGWQNIDHKPGWCP